MLSRQLVVLSLETVSKVIPRVSSPSGDPLQRCFLRKGCEKVKPSYKSLLFIPLHIL